MDWWQTCIAKCCKLVLEVTPDDDVDKFNLDYIETMKGFNNYGCIFFRGMDFSNKASKGIVTISLGFKGKS